MKTQSAVDGQEGPALRPSSQFRSAGRARTPQVEHMTPSITRRRFAALSSLLCPWPTLGFAQGAYPSRPVKLIIPWPPGGGVDVFGRAFQVRLGELLGQPIIIENIGGGSGRIGTIAAARGAPDGYTILLANDTLAALEALQAPGSAPLRAQFAPVTLTVSAP